MTDKLIVRFTVLCATFFMLLLDFTIVAVALPAMQSDFRISAAEAQWIVSTYAIALAGFLILTGRCADLFGRRRFFTIGLALFTLASLAAGFAPTAGVLIALRGLQGLGAAIVTPAALAIVMDTYPTEPLRDRVLGWWNTIGSAGLAAGMLIGGVLVQYFGWRSVFFVNVPVGAIVLALTPWIVPRDAVTTTREKLDVVGAILLTCGLVLLVFTIESLADRVAGWDTWVELAGAIVLLAIFAFSQSRIRSPLISKRLLACPNLVAGGVLNFFQPAAYTSALVFASLFAQRIDKYSPLATGFAFLPASLVLTFVAGPLAPRLARQIGARATGIIGSLCLLAGCVMLLTMPAGAPYWLSLLPATCLAGFGAMSAYQIGMIAALANVSPSDQGAASGFLNTLVQIGISIGVAAAASLADASGNLSLAFIVSTVFAILTFGAVFAVHQVDRAAIPKRHHVPFGHVTHRLLG